MQLVHPNSYALSESYRRATVTARLHVTFVYTPVSQIIGILVIYLFNKQRNTEMSFHPYFCMSMLTVFMNFGAGVSVNRGE